ncbi:putative transposase, partial [Desulfovibrio desulfuricans]
SPCVAKFFANSLYHIALRFWTFFLTLSRTAMLQSLCKYKGVEILKGHLMPDHIHMLVSIPPKISVSSFMGYLKGKSSLMIFDKHANLKYKFGNRKFWAEGYYVSTVGLNEATIKKYIQQQEKHDIMQDKLTSREYQDPFKG